MSWEKGSGKSKHNKKKGESIFYTGNGKEHVHTGRWGASSTNSSGKKEFESRKVKKSIFDIFGW